MLTKNKANAGSPKLKTPIHFPPWMDQLSLEGAFSLLAKAKLLEAEGKSIVHLEIGDPDFDTPQNIKDAAIRSLQAGQTHYSPNVGIMELRKTVAEYVSKTRRVPIRAEEVFITPGAKPVICFALLMLVSVGDEVIIPTPAYPTYESIVRTLGGTPVFLELQESEDFRFDKHQLEKKITPKTRLIILNSPHNPTGGVLTPDDLEHVAHLSKKHDFFVLSDEIYSRIIYEHSFSSYLHSEEMKERTILVDGFSKTYAMTGWRLGYGIMPTWMIEQMIKLVNNSIACTATFVQHAGIEGLTGPQDAVQTMVNEFKRRRDVMVDGLNAIPGFHCRKPHGAFYVFPNIQGTKMTSRKLSDFLLNQAGVAALAGTDFGAAGEGYLRFSYANSVENIQTALRQMREVLS